MAKAERAAGFACTACGLRTPKWLGRCPDCGAWGSMGEVEVGRSSGKGIARLPLAIAAVEAGPVKRDSTGIGELDRVLGGGLVPGAAILLGGDPGIGKSTLLLAAMHAIAQQGPVLYVSGEESPRQIRLRGERLGALSNGLMLFAEGDVEAILATAERMRPRALAIDSIQTVHLPQLGGAPGGVAQLREVVARLVAFAKETDTPVFLVGHVTKDGAIAGPRVVEHMVDTVLYFEGDRGHAYRILRAHKNRFGSTNEIGVFEMKGSGLSEVPNPSALFLAERPRGAPGTAVAATLSGTRPVLVEVQALATPSQIPAPRRTCLGVDSARVGLLAAVLERKCGIDLAGCDLYVNVIGGLELTEPACDLAVAAALVSSLRDKPIAETTLVLGEIGLAGELRAVGQLPARLAEAAQLGFTRAIVPLGAGAQCEKPPLELVPVATLESALQVVFG